MSNPDSFIDEVTEEVRRDRLFRLFRKYGWIGGVVVALIVACTLAFYSVRLVHQSLLFNDIATGLDATPLWIPQLGMAAGTCVLALAFAVELADLLTGRKVRENAGDGELARTE